MLLRCLPGMKRIKRVNYDGLRDRVFQCVKVYFIVQTSIC